MKKPSYAEQGFKKRHPLLLKLEGWYQPKCSTPITKNGRIGTSFGPTMRYSEYGRGVCYGDCPPFKLSCRFKDILRCSKFNGKFVHFLSCFASGQTREEQPLLRCKRGNWAIIYTPDKYGDFMGRCFVHLEKLPFFEAIWHRTRYELVIDKIYGNRLSAYDIVECLEERGMKCRMGSYDTYL